MADPKCVENENAMRATAAAAIGSVSDWKHHRAAKTAGGRKLLTVVGRLSAEGI
jgi:hypothetical protein